MFKNTLVLILFISLTSCSTVKSSGANILESKSWLTGQEIDDGITIVSGQLEGHKKVVSKNIEIL